MYQVKEAPNLLYVGVSADQSVAHLNYSVEGTILTIWHTEVAVSLEGQGIAGKLVDYAVDYARKSNLLINPICSYAAARFAKKPEYDDIDYRRTENK